MAPEEVPPCGPGLFTDTPTDHELFFHNMIEVPKYGDECQGCINCLQGSYCPQHPHGCPGGSRETGDCVLTAPGKPAATAARQPEFSPDVTPAATEASDSATRPASLSAEPDATSGRRGSSVRPTGSTGLISPLMR